MIKYLIAAFVLFLTIPAQAEDRWMSIPPAPPMPEAASSGTVNVNGIDMYHAIYGDADGTPILLIHGGLAHGDIWAAQVADLMQDHTVIVADTRGHGRSTNDGSEYTYARLAADYLALLDQIGVDRVHLVGWSDGANIGYSISQTNPERLASHFAHAGNITLDGVDPSVETNEVFGTYVGMMAGDYAEMSPTPDGFENFLGAVAKMWGSSKPGGPDALKSVTVPTLVVQSEFDEAILMDHSKMIAEIMPSADFLVLEDVSHFASFQAADEYTDAIRNFIEP
ncbi:alpha/beta fold hydrolase [Roseibium album]|uniref:Haloacetate dehalogenase H-1 n=1 Tax=Roseibium album TaxID=311410 RepID=A0A0M7AZ28_9HYPH|nr:alpha/beta hydrolase [Roseibium album]MBG6154740.1 pimeloyl-ACP methyl ester carboxylesterase [Labrenzia sp. EL_162]MBG6162018.1 pimeloyl-ACP methyl ester carboxylesterase [Labrenzia sp. EL_195]MBG6193130.1 pimeloyl-ACP methyl ester carboxylesterase [Labrenzia sp. EL_159]CTQ62016.1 Haloacetate dehalogenase H-1 [Roseibium album]CTQ78352.1 Haloacetate dehalogenase H-1 [Roseibium album]